LKGVLVLQTLTHAQGIPSYLPYLAQLCFPHAARCQWWMLFATQIDIVWLMLWWHVDTVLVMVMTQSMQACVGRLILSFHPHAQITGKQRAL